MCSPKSRLTFLKGVVILITGNKCEGFDNRVRLDHHESVASVHGEHRGQEVWFGVHENFIKTSDD